MAEYIDRGTAIAKLTALEVTEPNATMADVKRVLADIPAADVVPVVHGRWIRKPHWCVSCSYCGKCMHDYEGEVELYNYCPNCGAKMDEVE